MDQAQLITEQKKQIADLSARNLLLEAELAQLKRLIYGQKRERFIPDQHAAQTELALGLEAAKAVATTEEKISYTRKKKKPNQNHPGRNPLPEHLEREQIIIEPDVDTAGMVRIGEELTETLEIEEARLYVRQEIRPKYLEKTKDEQGQEQSIIHIADQPERPLPRSMAGISLLVHILLSKYCDHLPLDRQRKIFLREQVTLASSTLSDWVAAVGNLLEPLYEKLRREVLKQEYIMADESRMPVQDKATKGKTHKGYMWVYYAPLIKLVFFDYQQGRGKQYPKETLKDFQGYLQTDGYEVYDALFVNKEGVELLGCMAHARRYFDKALQSDKQKASYAMKLIQQLYDIERKAKDQQLNPEKRKMLRQKDAFPILDTLKQWATENYPEVLPKSPIGKALAYYLRREEKLRRYLHDGRLEIDNNYVENSIRPLALGRKNYLFAGSHKAAQYAAMIYSFIGSCEKLGINPKVWLKDVLQRIASIPVNQLDKLLPNHWEPGEMNL